VVTDGASEESQRRYDRIADVDPARVRVVHQPTARGVSRARNLGAALHGDAPNGRVTWLGFCDDDDRWAPDKAQRMIDAIASVHGARWAGSGCVVVDVNDRLIGSVRPPASGDPSPLLLRYNAVPCGGSGVIVDRLLFHEVGGFDPRCSNAEDWDLNTRLSLAAPAAFVDAPLVAYLMHDDTTSSRTTWDRSDVGHLDRAYAAVRAERGIEFDPDLQGGWVAYRLLRGGSGRMAARLDMRGFRKRKDPRLLVKAGVELASPRTATRLADRSGARNVPAGWREEAARWLPDLH
jgi:GT2 family glycosyltransferase